MKYPLSPTYKSYDTINSDLRERNKELLSTVNHLRRKADGLTDQVVWWRWLFVVSLLIDTYFFVKGLL